MLCPILRAAANSISYIAYNKLRGPFLKFYLRRLPNKRHLRREREINTKEFATDISVTAVRRLSST